MKPKSSTFLIEKVGKGETSMGLVVSFQVIRDLIADGEYLVECIEQREHGKVAVTLALRSRAQPYSIQIETTDTKLEGLFRALLNHKPARAEKGAIVKMGSQPVPMVEVDSLPADAAKRRRGRKLGVNSADRAESPTSARPSAGSRTSARQLVLVAPETAVKPTTPPIPTKRRRAPRASARAKTP
jgi:hypothetical protein